MENIKKKSARFALLFVASLAFSMESLAQEPAPVPQPLEEQEQQKKEPVNLDEKSPADQPAPVVATAPAGPLDAKVHPAGRAVPWLGTSSPLRWGSFSVGNFTYQQISDHFQPLGNLPSENINLSILRTSIVFDRFFAKQQRIVLQYEPQLAVLNGKLAGNAGLDNDLFLGTTFPLTPRLTLVIKDWFADVRSRRLFPPDYLAVDQQAGNLIQNNFLQNAGSYLTNQVSGVITYEINPRLTIVVSPSYKYVHATNDNEVLFMANGHDISNATALTYALTARQSIGVLYTLEVLRQKGAASFFGNTYFHTPAFYYANRLSKTLWFRGQFGANLARYPGQVPPVNTLAGTLFLVKSFTHSSFAFGYSRGRGAEGDKFITVRTGDLINASYSQQVSRRLMWNSGAGYYRETGADPRNFGNLLSTSLDFELHRNIFIFGNYFHTFQKSSTPQLLSGTRNTFIFGLKWVPQPLVTH